MTTLDLRRVLGWDNDGMKATEQTPAGTNLEVFADLDAVLQHLTARTPLDPEVARRVRQRSEEATEELRQRYGQLDVAVDLIREIRDKE